MSNNNNNSSSNNTNTNTNNDEAPVDNRDALEVIESEAKEWEKVRRPLAITVAHCQHRR